MEKLLPHRIDAECGVLGSIIIDPEAIALVADKLNETDFYREAHRILYRVIIGLYQSKEPADYITICDELERQHLLAEVGGDSYITSLTNGVPTSGNVEYYAGIVRSKAIFRRLIHGAGQIAALAYEEDETALQQSEEIIFNISKTSASTDFEDGEDIFAHFVNTLEKLQVKVGALVGVPTGFHSLDQITGGLQRSDLIILAARPGMGKTSFVLAIMYNAAIKAGKRVAFFSLEMSKHQLMLRLVSMDTGINGQRLRNGRIDSDEWDIVVESGERLSTNLIQIDDTAGITVSAMRSKARRLQAEMGIDLIIVDYLQLMQAHMNGKRIENRVQELQEISGGLKALAKELDVPVIALSQLSRKVEERQEKIPQLSDLRESGSIEQDADIVGFIYREDYYAGFDPETGESLSKRPNEADIIIEKHRNGPTGEITLYWDGERTRFFNSYDEHKGAYARK